jgi:hypothetical protein
LVLLNAILYNLIVSNSIKWDDIDSDSNIHFFYRYLFQEKRIRIISKKQEVIMDIKVERVMDRNKIATSIHSILDCGVDLLKKDRLEAADHGKIKVLRTLGTHVNAAVAMVQQETAQVRTQLVAERMKQLGYDRAPGLPQGGDAL